MKLTKSKQFLADAIHTSGKGWSDGANWAVQNGDHGRISFSENKPVRHGKTSWMAEGGFKSKIEVCGPQKNWHQTVLSREEYFSAYPAEPVADADGWIEWCGGERPVDGDSEVDVKLRSGEVRNSAFAMEFDWSHGYGDLQSTSVDIVAYRPHKPEVKSTAVGDDETNLAAKEELDSLEYCESVTRSIPEPEAKPTIEQLAADYRNKLDYADRKRQEADDAKAAANAALGELVAAGEAFGLVISASETQRENEWIGWNGGLCPVRKGTLVDIKTRDGTVVTSIKAGLNTRGQIPDASQQFWDNDDMHNDIVSYRICK